MNKAEKKRDVSKKRDLSDIDFFIEGGKQFSEGIANVVIGCMKLVVFVIVFGFTTVKDGLKTIYGNNSKDKKGKTETASKSTKS
jgi:hypothetical protein